MATTKIEESSDFFITDHKDGQSPYEFSINYIAPSPLAGREIQPISRYLYAPVNLHGKNEGPLTLRLDAKDKYTAMTIHSRHVRHLEPVYTKDWLSSRDIFYIGCNQRPLRRKSFICVKRTPRNLDLSDEFITCCVNTIKKHSESREQYMLFRLLRSSKRNVVVKKPEEEPTLGIRTTLLRTAPAAITTNAPGEEGNPSTLHVADNIEMEETGV